MNKNILSIGFVMAALAVVLGAFGAHYLKTRVEIADLAIFETGVKYQMYHAFAIIISGILYLHYPTNTVKWASKLFILGIVLFSFSLYILTWFKTLQLTQFYWVGAITPIGGLCFVGGWLLLAKELYSKK